MKITSAAIKLKRRLKKPTQDIFTQNDGRRHFHNEWWGKGKDGNLRVSEKHFWLLGIGKVTSI